MGPAPQTSFVSGGFGRAMLAGDRLKDRLKERPASPSHSRGWFYVFSAFITIVITTTRLELRVVSSTCFMSEIRSPYRKSLVEQNDLQGYGGSAICGDPLRILLHSCCPVVSDFVVGPLPHHPTRWPVYSPESAQIHLLTGRIFRLLQTSSTLVRLMTLVGLQAGSPIVPSELFLKKKRRRRKAASGGRNCPRVNQTLMFPPNQSFLTVPSCHWTSNAPEIMNPPPNIQKNTTTASCHTKGM